MPHISYSGKDGEEAAQIWRNSCSKGKLHDLNSKHVMYYT